MTSFLLQGLIVSVAVTESLETLARDYVAATIPGEIGYIILINIFAPLMEVFTKIFALLNRHAEIIKLGFLSGQGFGIAEFFVRAHVPDVLCGCRILPLCQ